MHYTFFEKYYFFRVSLELKKNICTADTRKPKVTSKIEQNI